MDINRCDDCVKSDICPIKEELEELFEHIEKNFCRMVSFNDIEIKLRCKHYVRDVSEDEEEIY